MADTHDVDLDIAGMTCASCAARLERLTPAELHTLQAVWYAAQARGLQTWFARTGTEETVDPAWPLRPDLPAAAA